MIIEIPAAEQVVFEAYRDRLDEILRPGLSRLRIQEALFMYQRRAVSLGRAAGLAGVSREDFVRQARAANIGPTADPDMAGEELA